MYKHEWLTTEILLIKIEHENSSFQLRGSLYFQVIAARILRRSHRRRSISSLFISLRFFGGEQRRRTPYLLDILIIHSIIRKYVRRANVQFIRNSFIPWDGQFKIPLCSQHEQTRKAVIPTLWKTSRGIEEGKRLLTQ